MVEIGNWSCLSLKSNQKKCEIVSMKHRQKYGTFVINREISLHIYWNLHSLKWKTTLIWEQAKTHTNTFQTDKHCIISIIIMCINVPAHGIAIANVIWLNWIHSHPLRKCNLGSKLFSIASYFACINVAFESAKGLAIRYW